MFEILNIRNFKFVSLKGSLIVLEFFACGFLFTNEAFASDVVINEFLTDPESSQWVELYNKGSKSIDIGGWYIDDNGGSQKFTIPANTVIDPLEFKVFESSNFNLNRTSPDTVKLLHNTEVIDSYSYNSGPGSNNTFGRINDGEEWGLFTNSSKGLSNATSSPVPSSTPMPTVPSKPSPTIQPPTPTSKPTVTTKPSPTTKQSSATPVVLANNISKTKSILDGISTQIATLPAEVLGEHIGSVSATSIPTPTQQLKQKSKNVKVFAANNNGIFIGIGGFILLLCGILGVYYHFKKQKEYES
jgi:hypothetical protein